MFADGRAKSQHKKEKKKNNVKTSCNYTLEPSLPAKKKILLILAKDSLKTEIELFP